MYAVPAREMMLRILKWRKVGTRVMVQVRIAPHTRAHTLRIIFFTDADREVIGMLADSHNKANRLVQRRGKLACAEETEQAGLFANWLAACSKRM